MQHPQYQVFSTWRDVVPVPTRKIYLTLSNTSENLLRSVVRTGGKWGLTREGREKGREEREEEGREEEGREGRRKGREEGIGRGGGKGERGGRNKYTCICTCK